MTKNKIYDLLIIILIYIGLSCIPFNLLYISPIFVTFFQILSQIITFLLILFILRKSPLKVSIKKTNSKNVILFIPLVIVCFSNFFCLLMPESKLILSFNFQLLLDIFLSVAIAWNEEYIFRLILIDNLDSGNDSFKNILISSAIFALCHITHFLSSFNPVALIDVIYTFGIGIVLGFIYIYSDSLIFAFIFHAIFNIINNNLSLAWIQYGDNLFLYYLINVIVALVAAVYLLIVYMIKLKKSEKVST